jgi:membrane-bound inhibitor of C-type lysozyme
MWSIRSTSPRPRPAVVGAVAAAFVFVACGNLPSKEELEAGKNTISCQLAGERLVIRFDAGEARLLMADGERITLYQIPSASGARYSNGTLELRGKSMELQLIRNGIATQLADCQPYAPPK